MREREELQAELLDRYWLALERDDAASPPEGLDPEIAATVGIHPHNAADAPADWRARLRDLAHSPEVVAVGETGLDYHYRHSPPEVQRRLFLDQLELAAELGRPVVVHNREADDDLVAILRDGGRHVRGVLHCFAGGDALLEAALEAGWYASFAGLVTFRSFDGVDRLRRVPLTRLLVETDSPYLTPVPFRGRRNEPAYVALVGRKVAELRDQDEATVAAATARNAESLFARAWS